MNIVTHSRFVVIVASLSILSCAPAVYFSSSGNSRDPKSSDYYIFVLPAKISLPTNAVVLGEISVTDAGMSVNCDLPDVIEKAKQRARKVGADAIQITSIREPDLMSTCYWIKALAIAFDHADSATIAQQLSQPPNTAFISFADADTCSIAGERIDSASNVYLFPLIVRTVYDDGKVEGAKYPTTQASITRYVDSLLHTSGRKVIIANKNLTHADSLAKFQLQLLDNASKGRGSPSTWANPFGPGMLDSNSVMYSLIGVERESQEQVRARFYVIISNSRGQIVSWRCRQYNPGKWSSQIAAFIEDTKGWLPLVQ